MVEKKRQIIVDEDDKIIGHKYRDEMTTDDIYRVSALWLTNSNDDIMLAQRSFSKKNGPGLWGPAVAGTLDEGETYLGNITKETNEEIGLDVSPEQFTVGPKTAPHTTSDRKYFGQWYLYKIDKPAQDFMLQEEEVAQVEWFTSASIREALRTRSEDFVPSMSFYFDLLCKPR